MKLDKPEHRRVLGLSASTPLATWYDLLGVPAGASREVLDRAMLERMVQVRKYQVGAYEAHALELMSELSQAFVTLSDPRSRAEYDQTLAAGSRQPPTLEDLAAEVLAEARAPRKPETPSKETSSPLPLPSQRPRPVAKATPPAETPATAPADPARPPCPQCGKPMPTVSAVCMHCGFKRLAGTAASPPRKAEANAPLASLSNAAISELLRLNLSPEQTLARLQLLANLYRAQREAAAIWSSTPPMFCSFCRHPLALRSDAHALSSGSLAECEVYVTYFAKKREAQGKLQVSWPLTGSDLIRVRQAIVGSNLAAMRLFCRTCAERILGSPRNQE